MEVHYYLYNITRELWNEKVVFQDSIVIPNMHRLDNETLVKIFETVILLNNWNNDEIIGCPDYLEYPTIIHENGTVHLSNPPLLNDSDDESNESNESNDLSNELNDLSNDTFINPYEVIPHNNEDDLDYWDNVSEDYDW